MLVNLLPYQILQPFVDAAFKKRGIDPENFWRGAGLPAYRWPDPNGTRFANGAPPPAPTPLEGTPDFPGPAVPAGTPCSYTPPAGRHPDSGGPAAVLASRGRTIRRRSVTRRRTWRRRHRTRTAPGTHRASPAPVCRGRAPPDAAGRPGPAAARAAGCADGTAPGPVEPVPAVRRAARRPAGTAATSRTRPASAGRSAARCAVARGHWRSLTDVDDLQHPKHEAAQRFPDRHW